MIFFFKILQIVKRNINLKYIIDTVKCEKTWYNYIENVIFYYEATVLEAEQSRYPKNKSLTNV